MIFKISTNTKGGESKKKSDISTGSTKGGLKVTLRKFKIIILEYRKLKRLIPPKTDLNVVLKIKTAKTQRFSKKQHIFNDFL